MPEFPITSFGSPTPVFRVKDVDASIAYYLDADVTLVRVIIAVLALLNGVGLALYLAAWLLIPEDGEDQSIAAAWIAGRQNRSR